MQISRIPAAVFLAALLAPIAASRADPDVRQGRRADPLFEVRRVPSPDDVRADVAREVRRGAAVGEVDQATASRRAPCRHGAPIPQHGVFKNDPRLTDKEIATILAWVDGGAPKGDDKDMPAVPSFTEGWTIGEPDAVFEMKEAFQIPATGIDRISVHPHSDRHHRGQVAGGDRDQAAGARARASRDRVHACRPARRSPKAARSGRATSAASRRTSRA